MNKIMNRYPIFLLLIPLFFITHNSFEYYSYLKIGPLLLLSLIYTVVSILFAFLVFLRLRAFWKAALITSSIQIVYFYFSSFHQFLKSVDGAGTYSRYMWVLPFVIFLFLSCSAAIVRMKEQPKRLFLFLNSLFALFIVIDLIGILQLTIHRHRQTTATTTLSKTEVQTENLPSIYLLVFDEYASSASLKERFQFSNDLDSQLQKIGFRIVSHSKSNYNFTPFSIASMLNTSYLKGFREDSITAKDYQQTYQLIRTNSLVPQLREYGYTIINRSIFDLGSQPAFTHSSFLPSGLWILRKQTLIHYLNQDLGWHLIRYNTVFKKFYLKAVMESKTSNRMLSEELVQVAAHQKNKPVFVYAHFNMPHPPYYFDSTGSERSEEQLVAEHRFQINEPPTYLSYLKYTNTSIQKLVANILEAEQGQAVVLVIGDHGYRSHIQKNEHLFMNFNAIYLPPQYKNIPTPDTLSLVNEFRFILNTLTQKRTPFLTDSFFLLKDANPENAYKN